MGNKAELFEKRMINLNGDLQERVIYQRHMADDIFQEASGVIDARLEIVASGLLNEDFVLAGPDKNVPNPHYIYDLDANVIPDASGIRSVGTVAKPWNEGYFDTLYGDGSNLTGVGGSANHSTLSNLAWSVASHTIDTSVIPTSSGSYSLGSVSLAFDEAYVDKVNLEADPTTPLQAATKQYVDNQTVYTPPLSIPITVPTGSDDFLIWRAPWNITITAINGVCMDGTSLTCGINECDGDGDNAVAICTQTAVTTSNTSLTGAITNASVDVGDYISFTSTAMSGTVTKMMLSVEYTID